MKIVVTFLFLFNLHLIANPYNSFIQGFESNLGQLGDTEGRKVKEVIFYSKNKDIGVYITDRGVSYVIYRYEELPQAAGSSDELLPHYKEPKPMKVHYSRIDVDLLNSTIDRSKIEYKDELPGYSNYYLGHCPEGVLYVKSYREVRIKDVYRGID
ncbi:MAG: hypothetical protein N2510_02355, partial [Ignavibacteria bacterium]|nr:hypothetical protein [Ignavibacteria bacterium]